jgi:hypothetical protein
VLDGVSPDRGPLAGGTAVELTGSHFQDGLTVTFGDQPATDVVVHDAGRVSCVTPSADATGPVSVRVENPDAQSSQLQGAFTYEEGIQPGPTWCQLVRPETAAAQTGEPTPPIYGRVFGEGITEGPGAGAGLTAELGFGPTGTDPGSSAQWSWTDAVFSADAGSGDDQDEYVASLTVGAAGDYDYAYRFARAGDPPGAWLYCDLDGSDNGYASAQAGALTVSGPTALTLTDVTPPRGAVLGGDAVTLTGTGFTASTTVSFGPTVTSSVTLVSATELTALVPPGAGAGAVDVTVQNPDPASDTLPGGFEYLAVFTPTVDGDLADWDAALLAATNTVTSDWSGAALSALYVAFDDTHLYLGIEGQVTTSQAIVGYLDVDFGQATGLSDMSNITDGTGNIDAALSGVLQVTATGYGAEIALASKEMSEVIDGLDDAAGWRGLSNPADMPWLVGTVDAGPGSQALECAIALHTLWPGGVPTSGADAALVVKITDYEGNAYANQSLPEDAGGATASQVLVFRVYPASQY